MATVTEEQDEPTIMAILSERIKFAHALMRSWCLQLIACIQMGPVAFVLIMCGVLLLVSLIALFNVCEAKLFTWKGALVINLIILWLGLRLIVRVLVFPGSIILWKRNTEASYRVEMAKQFSSHLAQLQMYIQVATARAQVAPGATAESAMLGCMVVEGLARNFRVQQRDQVRFTKEQAQLRLLIQGVEDWLNKAKVCDRRGRNEVKVPLVDFLQRTSQQSYVSMPLAYVVSNSPLAQEAKDDAGACLDRLEQLLVIMESLQKTEESFFKSTRRFLSTPTVGSLHQLRAELLVRYSGHHYWVRVPTGRKIDGMFISCDRGENADGGGIPEDGPGSEGAGSVKEDVPLKELIGSASSRRPMGPVIIWCNPNAAYYESMAYESHWLDFYLNQGCSVFLFNYSGFGRSEGSPTPAALAADGNAVIDFLRRRGFDNIGVHGRSIGGIAACSLAAANPDVVKLLIADRTFSTLSKAARYTFGDWASKGLSLAATWANNFDNFAKVRCYKVMLVDPKDATIPEMAALRTSMALKMVEQMVPNERFVLEDAQIQRVAEAWLFLLTLIAVYDREDSVEHQGQGRACACCVPAAKRQARVPVFGKPAPAPPEGDPDRLESGEEQRLVGQQQQQQQQRQQQQPKRGDSRKLLINRHWLEENHDVVRSAMSSSVDALRVVMDIAGTQLNASGLTLDDVLSRPTDEACFGLKCFLANIQVWGSLGTLRGESRAPTADRDIELMLRNGADIPENPELTRRLSTLAAETTPEKLEDYHRRLARTTLNHVRRDFRQGMPGLRQALGAPSDDTIAVELKSVALGHLREIEGLLNGLHRFFRGMDLAAGSAPKSGSPSSSRADPENAEDLEEIPPVPPSWVATPSGEPDVEVDPSSTVLPKIDRQAAGYVMCIECGHNGILSEGELHQLTMHVKAARFGKHAAGADEAAAETVTDRGSSGSQNFL